MTYHQLPASEAVQTLNSDSSRGLRSEQVQERLASVGENKLKEKKKKTGIEGRALKSLLEGILGTDLMQADM